MTAKFSIRICTKQWRLLVFLLFETCTVFVQNDKLKIKFRAAQTESLRKPEHEYVVFTLHFPERFSRNSTRFGPIFRTANGCQFLRHNYGKIS